MTTCEGCPYPNTCSMKHRCAFRHTAEVELREAACEFASLGPPTDAKDSIGLRSNRKLLRAAGKLARMAQKRGYSREFKPHGDTGKRYLLDKIPAGLWSAVKDKCKREGVSVRALILKLLTDWIER